MLSLDEVLKITAARHSHLCPRQVLGGRIGLAGVEALGLEAPRRDKRLLIIMETDGCFADGVEAATGCTIGRRTLRVEDYGKIAATFVDVKLGKAIRISPRLDIRQRANQYAPEEKRHYFAQLTAYQLMPDVQLLSIQEVRLTTPIEALISRAGVRVNCEMCGEEIINEREIMQDGIILCKACVGKAYYQVAPSMHNWAKSWCKQWSAADTN
ncbi:MAG: FmdE family protein [Anaerolineales bacterium]|nr:FmdE family protein [Anaerolineales bacterium]